MEQKKYDWLMGQGGTESEKRLRLKLLEEESKKITAFCKEIEREMTDPTHPNFKNHFPLLARAYALS